MKHFKLKALLSGLCLFGSSSLYAVPVTTWEVKVDSVFVEDSVVPDSGITYAERSLRWGNDTGSGQSGLDIEAPVTANVDTNGAPGETVKVTHLNRPITGTSLEQVDVKTTLTLTPVTPPDNSAGPFEFTFMVHFRETPNDANPCEDGGANGSGFNANGCADIFVLDGAALSFDLLYDDPDGEVLGRIYTVSLFELTQGLNPLPDAACTAADVAPGCIGLRTPEGQDTTVQFAVGITTSVPEPGSLPLFGAAFLGAFFVNRRKSQQQL